MTYSVGLSVRTNQSVPFSSSHSYRLPAQCMPGVSPVKKDSTSNRFWYVVHTYSCRERVVKRALEKYNIHHYLPLLVQKRPWSDRIKTIYTPLFPGYLFVNVNPQMEEYWKVCTTPGVSKILGDSAGPAVIPEEQILDIQKLLSRDQPLYTIRGIQSGQSAMVVAGPLQGIRGIFVQKKEKEYLVLHIKILGHSIIAEVKQQDVEIIHPANHVACTK